MKGDGSEVRFGWSLREENTTTYFQIIHFATDASKLRSVLSLIGVPEESRI